MLIVYCFQVWSGPICPAVDIDPWPKARSFHTAVCLQDPSVPCNGHRQLLVLWGMDKDAEPINDLWVLDINQLQWKQVSTITAPLLQTKQGDDCSSLRL